jgi:hypothetical protein
MELVQIVRAHFTFIWGLRRAVYHNIEVSQIVFVGYGADTRDTIER